MEWMYNYQGACSAGQYAVVTAIAGNASFWPNLVGPILIRKYGKKKILVCTNLLSVVFILAMLPIVHSSGKPYAIWVLLAVTFVNQFITSLGHLLGPGVNADIRDYQHYISGVRIDGMFSAVGLIGNAITMITGMVLPAIYSKAGLNKDVAEMLGYDKNNVYEVLFNRDYFISICSVLIVASAVGAALNAIPYFFYDFTETKQKAIVDVLKIRAAAEDYDENGERNDSFEKALEIIRNSKAIVCDKKPCSEVEYQIAKFVTDELNKYSTPEGVRCINECKLLTQNGTLSFLDVMLTDKSAIKQNKTTNEIQKNFKRDALIRADSINAAKRALKHHFKDGFKELDYSSLMRLYDEEKRIDIDFERCCQDIKSNKRLRLNSELKDRLLLIKVEKRKIEKSIRKAEKEFSAYYRIIKPYNDALRIQKQSESYRAFLLSLNSL